MNTVRVELVRKYDTWYCVHIFMQNGEFSGGVNFDLDIDDYNRIIVELERLYDLLTGEFTITEDDTDDYITIKCEKFGHIKISAQLGGSWRDNCVKLVMHTDQTVLKEIIQQFKEIKRG